VGAAIGRIQQEVNRQITSANKTDFFMLSNLHQSVLQGDPALVIYPMTKPDYQIQKMGLFVQSKNAIGALARADSVQVGVAVANLGLYDSLSNVKLTAKIVFQNGKTVERSIMAKSVAFQDTLLATFARDAAISRIQVTADSDQMVAELNENNNTATLDVDWAQAANANVFPPDAVPDRLPPLLEVFFDGRKIRNDDFVQNNPQITLILRDENPLAVSDTTLLEVFLKRCPTCSFQRIANRNLGLSNAATNTLKADVRLGTLAAGKYELLVTGRDAKRNAAKQPYQISFNVTNTEQPVEVRVYPNPATVYVKFEAKIQAPTPPELIEIEVFDAFGRKITTLTQAAHVGTNEILWTPPNPLAPGEYLYKLSTYLGENKIQVTSGKIVLY
jgi:hypothetical protein